jgi:hypothetical protein
MKRKKEKQALFLHINQALKPLIAKFFDSIYRLSSRNGTLPTQQRLGLGKWRSPENKNSGSLIRHVWHSYPFIQTHEMASFAQRASRVLSFLLTRARYMYFHYIACFNGNSSRQYSRQHEPQPWNFMNMN